MASFSTHTTLMVATVSLFITAVFAGFDPSSSSNVAIYWGQNSYSTAAGASNAQQRLSYYCSNIDIDIIPLAFLDEINTPLVNFANADDSCTVFSGTTLLECPQLEEDIQTCQSTYGKTIMLSIGGATYTEGGFSSTSAASVAADTIWAMFGPEQSDSSVNRPFGKAVVDGFDFDFESATSNMVSFASELRSKMDAATAEGDKSYYLSAAPQCPYPDAADNDMLAGEVSFDFVMVQFYNNYCGLQSYASGSSTQSSFNFGTWDDWARTSSKNPNVRVFLGIPGSSTAAGSGYVSDSSLASIITYSKTFSSFGGVMAWDMSQVYANPGFLELITDSLQSGASPNTTASTSRTSEPATSGSVWPTYTTSTFATYRTSPREVSATSLLPYTPAPAPPAGSTFTTKTTSSRQVHSSLAPTTLSTATRSAVPSDWSAAKGTGSCVTPSAATVTSYVTVAKSASLSSNFGATKGTLNNSPAQPTTVRGETTVAQWGQCGGVGYSGSTQCESPYICVANSKWWAQCQ
ncbi:aminotransferase class III [Ophiostoma piceae UAMH 11346]|uniref:chitinase n=1 Tax=Ophiostoma piceae (strain UAMH 11346) TaxID=1262450 RepID=S3BWL5_OPHP1|nr:aminotransferase class III [Ophiostoma piceae UAMH 11346]